MKTKKKRKLHPESLMMSYGYKPEWSEGALKSPIFQTSTFVFKSAEEGKAFFEVAYGLRKPYPGEKTGLIYSRINNPDLEILEDRLTLWDEAEACAVFESGMSAITTVLLEFLKPGDLLLHSSPLYGGTDHFIENFLPKLGIHTLEFVAGQGFRELTSMLDSSGLADKLAVILVETPSNPTNTMIDITCCKKLAGRYGNRKKRVIVAVDNTYMGPLWQHPLKLGADIVLYSATKYIGGHSDVIAGACLGKNEYIDRVKVLRTFLGNMADPWTGWLLMRSLETLKVRMEQQAFNAQKAASFLAKHPKVEKVYYPGLLTQRQKQQYDIFKKQCSSPGAMLSFEIKGGEKKAFKFLNALKVIKLAVSLGGTESLIEHPASMTHAGVEEHHRKAIGITDRLIRLSVGIEHFEDIIRDLEQAFKKL